MQTVDPVKWEDQKIELSSADDQTRLFLTVFTEWMTLAEKLWDETYQESHMGELSGVLRHRRTLPQALRQAMVDTEEHHGKLSMEWIGQMLLLAREHWVHGHKLMLGLTRLEKRMLEQMEAAGLAAMAESAKL